MKGMSRPFFNPNCRKVNAKDIEIIDNNLRVLDLDSVSKLGHGYLFDTLISRQDSWDAYDSLPLIDEEVCNLGIPFSFDAHHQVGVLGANLEEVVCDFVNEWIRGKKYVVSCNLDFFYAVEFLHFDYDKVDMGVEFGGQNSHFVVFGEDRKRWLVFYSRFPFITVSFRGNSEELNIGGKPFGFWEDYFVKSYQSEEYGRSIGSSEYIKRTYLPRISGYHRLLDT